MASGGVKKFGPILAIEGSRWPITTENLKSHEIQVREAKHLEILIAISPE